MNGSRTILGITLGLGMGTLLAACNHPPRLDVRWANLNRELVGPQTPTKNTDELEGTVDGEKRSLASWAKRVSGGETIDVKLGPGTFVIGDTIVAKNVRLVIRGAGPEKTRIRLDTDDWRALTVKDCPSFELRGVTVAGYTGGGIDVHNCPRVVVNDCDFAGSRYGLELGDSVSIVDSCVFAGCETAIELAGGRLVTRGTAFSDCDWAVHGRGKLEALGCVIAGSQHHGIGCLCAPGSYFRSCLVGPYESIAGGGAPEVSHCMLFDDLFAQFEKGGDQETNVVVHPEDIEDFPRTLPYKDPLSLRCNLGAVHYALARARHRGEGDLEEYVAAILRTEARRYAEAAKKHMEKKELGEATVLARLAKDYVVAMGGPGQEELKGLEAVLR